MRRDLTVILQMGLAFAFIFSAFNSQGLIEISVLRRVAKLSPETGLSENSGYYSLSIIYFVFTFCNLLVPPIVQRLGAKWSQVVGASCYLAFMVMFLKINAILLYLGSAVLGFGAALLWTGNGCYLVDFSRDGKMSRNSGILWSMLQSSLIAGSFFLVFVLKSGDLIDSYDKVYSFFSIICGVGIFLLIALPGSPPRYEEQLDEVRTGSTENLVEPNDGEDRGRTRAESMGSLREQFAKTLDLFFSSEILTLSLPFLYTGFEMTFYTGVYTSCLSATSQLASYSDFIIPYNAFALGVGQILGGLFNGSIGKISRLKRVHFVLMGMVAHLFAFFLCFIILPFDSSIHKSEMPTYIEPTLFMTLVIAVLLGFADSCWQTQIMIILGQLFREDAVNAFASFKFFQSLAACISFYYGAHFFLHWQLLILVVGCFLSSLCFVKMEHELDLDRADALNQSTIRREIEI